MQSYKNTASKSITLSLHYVFASASMYNKLHNVNKTFLFVFFSFSYCNSIIFSNLFNKHLEGHKTCKMMTFFVHAFFFIKFDLAFDPLINYILINFPWNYLKKHEREPFEVGMKIFAFPLPASNSEQNCLQSIVSKKCFREREKIDN